MNPIATRRVLLAEDDSLVAGEVARILQKLGYEIAAIVDSGEAAVRQASALAPDLVLLNIGLRGRMDGIEAARQIRVSVGRPVVFLSALSDEMTLRRAKESEPYGYILKPFGERDLFVQIEMALFRHQMDTERAKLRREQEIAEQNLRKLRGLLAICAGCKKIEEKDGTWKLLEEFFAEHANIEFTHGFCPDCEKRLYGTQSRGSRPQVVPVRRPTSPGAPASPKEKPAAARPRVRKNEKPR